VLGPNLQLVNPAGHVVATVPSTKLIIVLKGIEWILTVRNVINDKEQDSGNVRRIAEELPPISRKPSEVLFEIEMCLDG